MPQKITSINGIIKDLVVNYNNFSVFALTEDNALYVWGNNQNGQLGIENSNGVTSTPTKVNGITGNIKKIYAGDYSTYALTEDSSLYAWGNNQNGQLGLGRDNVIVNTPTKINGITGTIKEVIVYNRPYNNTQYNYNHVYVITEDSSLYLWGNNEKGQLGLGQEKPIINTPTKIDTLGAVKNVYAGLDVIKVPGATGLYNTNYEGKAQACLDALNNHDFVYLHVEAPDEAGHEGDVHLKIKTIEDLDSRLVYPLLNGIQEKNIEARVGILPDHPTPVETRAHTREPIPFAIWGTNIEKDSVDCFSENACKKGGFGFLKGDQFIKLLLGIE